MLLIQGDGPECYSMETGADYRGTVSTSMYGDTCMEWATLSSYQRVSTETHPDEGLGEHNYCRNPDGRSKAWCYTKYGLTINVPGFIWGYCNIGEPNASCIGMYIMRV